MKRSGRLIDALIERASVDQKDDTLGVIRADLERMFQEYAVVVPEVNEEVITVRPGMVAWTAPGVYHVGGSDQPDEELSILSAIVHLLEQRFSDEGQELVKHRIATYLYERYSLEDD